MYGALPGWQTGLVAESHARALLTRDLASARQNTEWRERECRRRRRRRRRRWTDSAICSALRSHGYRAVVRRRFMVLFPAGGIKITTY